MSRRSVFRLLEALEQRAYLSDTAMANSSPDSGEDFLVTPWHSLIDATSATRLATQRVRPNRILQSGNMFRMADINESGSMGQNYGFNIESVSVHSTDGTVGSTFLFASKVSETVIDANTADQVWRTSGGEVEIRVHLTQDEENRRMDVQVTAGMGWTVEDVRLGAPFVFAALSSTRKTYSAFRGGQIQDWPVDGIHQQNSSLWPDTGYSPIAVFYDQRTTEGVGFISFDSGLKLRAVYWYTFAEEVHPYVRWDVNLTEGQTDSTTMVLHHGFNMPTNHFQYYRDNFLVPFMESEGIQEGSLPVTGVMATAGWPIDGNVEKSVQWALTWHAQGFLQLSPPDGREYFEPNPQTLPWYTTLNQASQVAGNQLLGVLINPFLRSYLMPPVSDPNDPAWFPGGGGAMSLTDPGVLAWLDRLKTDLASRGVNFAYWDTGGGPRPGQERLWFDVLKQWKLAGIPIAAETSNDLASYVTGTNLMWNFKNFDYSLLRTVTPHVKIIVEDLTDQLPDGRYWWDAAQQLGFIPLLNERQLQIWGRQRGIIGAPLP